MACPPIYKTDQAKLEASRERRRRHYAKNRDSILQRRQELRISKPSQEILELQKALAEALDYEDDATTSETEADDDENENDQLFDLQASLIAIKNIKDEMLALVPEPCAFMEGVVLQYVKSLPDDGNGKGDTSIVDSPKLKVEVLLRHAIPAQDQIMNFYGVSAQSRATESVSLCCLFTRRTQVLGDDWSINVKKLFVWLARRTLSLELVEISRTPTFSKNQPRTEWVTAEQKEFLQGLYNDFLKVQLEATLAAFWTEVYRTWFEKWPEISIMYPGVPDHESLTEEQNELLGIAVKKRHQQLRTWFNYRSQRGAQEAYTAASPDVQASCIATVQAERDAKASEGPDPRYNGDINVISYHTGVNEQGQNWMQATPEFNERHLKPFTAFVSRLFLEHMRKTRALSYVPPTPSQQDTSVLGAEQGVPEPGMQVFSHAPLPPASAPIASSLLSFDTPNFTSLCASGSSGYMELLTFDMYDDNLNVPPSSSTSLMPYLNSPSSSPISSWNRSAHDSQNYTSPHIQSHDILDSFLDQTAPSDLAPFWMSCNHWATESGGNAAAATADLALASSASEDAITEASNDPQPPLGTDSESVDAIVADAPPTVSATIVADVAAPQTARSNGSSSNYSLQRLSLTWLVPPAVRKTGRIHMETTQLVQANNIGQNMKQARLAAGHSIARGPPKKNQPRDKFGQQKSQKERKSRGKEQA
ncbi:uncharacterized protein EDB91DRAFT_1085701 [Suillus paluster]|uniref:uncharacterized protein n=1 Tax=Suillus paluster TaxID=48578 RepID=UPI001B86DB7E|nr:uncharacterized protein EDB91DRAFT_1085701 [Suillus paluster]KAG1729675.1 hypothetical protein EDB91DRAFT_1085701 [Suillus paluster]